MIEEVANEWHSQLYRTSTGVPLAEVDQASSESSIQSENEWRSSDPQPDLTPSENLQETESEPVYCSPERRSTNIEVECTPQRLPEKSPNVLVNRLTILSYVTI